MDSGNHPIQKKRVSYRSGEVILHDVSRMHVMYRVLSGEVHIEYDPRSEPDVVPAGELIGDIYRTATLVAVTDCVLEAIVG